MATKSRNRVLIIAATMVLMLQIQLLDVRAAENTESVAGLYIGKTFAASGPYNISGRHFAEEYLYLSPDGTFYEGYAFAGYDQLDRTNDVKIGRYSIQEDQVLFRYRSGSERAIRREAGNLDFSLIGNTKRLPICDGLKLSGTYQLKGFSMDMTFTSDGRFVDHGAMPMILNLTDSRIDSPARTLRPGPGTYSIKNHTITLRYAHGPVFRLFFYVDGDDRGQIDAGIMHIHTYELSRQGGSPAEQPSTPAAHLPKIEAPAGWKSQRDGGSKTITYFVPPDLPQGHNLVVAVNDSQPLANPDASRFPGRLHEAAVQGAVKNFTADGFRTESAMARDIQGKVPSSTGVFLQPDGKKLWMAMFTLVSRRELQFVLYMSDHEEFYKAYLPTVRAMLGGGESPPAPRIASLPPLASASNLPQIKVPSGWKIGRNGTNKNLTYVMPGDLAPGQEVRVLIADPERLPEGKSVAPDRFHDAIVQHSVKGMTAKGGRITKAFAGDTLGKTLSSTGLLTETNGKKFRMTMFTPMSSVEAQLVVYMAESDDLYSTYLPVVKAMLGEGDASLQAGMTSLETLLSKMRINVNALNGWFSEFDPKEEGTHFSPANLPAGQFVDLVVEKREKLTSTLAQAHDESVRKGIASLEKENGRLEGTPNREERDGTVFSSVRALLSNGMKIWGMSAATAVGDEMQEVSLITSSEDLSKQYLPTLKVTLAEVAGR